MGRFFTPFEVQKKLVPKDTDFAEVIELIKSSLSEHRVVESVILFGSSMWGSLSMRSDVDFLVSYKPSMLSELQAKMFGIHAFARARYVPLNDMYVPSDLALTSYHALGAGMRHHLDIAKLHGGRLIQNGNLAFFDYDSMEMDLCTYIRKKIDSVQKSIFSLAALPYDEMVVRLESAYRAPVHAARRYVISRHSRPTEIQNDKKHRILAEFRIISNPELVDTLDFALAADKYYEDALKRNLMKYNAEDYEQALLDAIDGLDHILSFLKKMSRVVG